MKNIAIFDLDHTLITCDSDVEWPKFLFEKGIIDDAFIKKSEDFFEDYKLGTMDIDAFLRFQLAPMKLYSKEKWQALHQEFMPRYILPFITTTAKDLVNQHLAQGDDVILLSATNEFIITPIAAEFGIEHVIGVQLAVDELGNYTGDYINTPSFKEGKIVRLQQWLDERKLSLSDYQESYFYSDSRNDIPLLSLVSQAIAVNPDEILKEHAEAQAWKIIEFNPDYALGAE